MRLPVHPHARQYRLWGSVPRGNARKGSFVKLKMAENSLFAILLRSPWWVSFLIAGAITVAVAALAPDNFRWLGGFGALPLFGVGFVAAWRQWKAPPASAIAAQALALRSMAWRDFAAALERHWAAQGAQVESITGLEADFCVQQGVRSTLVSARRWKAASHGVDAITHLAAAMRKRDVVRGQYLISHGTVSDSARDLARTENIELLEGDALARWMLDTRQ